MDQRRKTLAQHLLVTDAPTLQGARLEVLDQHVGAFQQLHQQFQAFRARQVDGDPLLVTVDAAKIRRVITFERRPPAPGLITAQRFQLDHVGAVVGQGLGAVGAAQHTAEIDDFHARQAPWANVMDVLRQIGQGRPFRPAAIAWPGPGTAGFHWPGAPAARHRSPAPGPTDRAATPCAPAPGEPGPGADGPHPGARPPRP